MPVLCCYEAGYEGFWLYRRLVAAGLRVLVIDPSSLLVNRARQAREDGSDQREGHDPCTDGLQQGGGSGAQRRQRSQRRAGGATAGSVRERQCLVYDCTAHTNRIRGLLLTQGIVGFDARADGADRQLDELVTGDGRRLGARLKDEICREIKRLRLVMEQLAHVDDERDAIALPKRSSACDGARNEDGADAAMITALARIKGVGPNDASVLVREAFWRKFANRREIAAWSGFAPTPWASGAISRDQGITKAGPASFRAYVIQLTWRWLQWQPESRLAQVVRRTDERRVRSRAPDHDRRARSKAARRAVALRDDRAAPDRRRRRLISVSSERVGGMPGGRVTDPLTG